MALFKCKMCGGNLEVTEGMTVCECEYCGTKQTVPKTRDDVMSNLFNRANNLRIKCEFDKAQEIYDKVVASDPSESEAYWGIILCKYGIEYVEDPATFKKVPTCHRTQLESVMTDVDYRAAIEHADVVQRSVYEEEARAIDKLQKDILEIVHKEQPFDVFICYKETDESGKRTNDSVIANDIYYQLTNEGFKVFYAAITLEDKLGQEYEPYIFAALNSAKVMLVIGSKPEYFNAVWVKNEWSRYMKLMKSDRSKLLIPCYKDMDAYDLPEEFSHLQAQDMSKIGFINDVIRGIKKVIVKDEPAAKAPAPVQTIVTAPASANVENLLKRGMLSLEDGKWDEADKFFEQVLNENVEEPRAYFGKMLSSFRVRSEENLMQSAPNRFSPLTDNVYYKKAMRFAGEEYKEYLTDLNNRYIYASAMKMLNSAKNGQDVLSAKKVFDKIPDYQPARTKSDECKKIAVEREFSQAMKTFKSANTEKGFLYAKELFDRIRSHPSAKEKSAECTEKAHEIVYNNACNILFGKSDKSQLEFAMREFGRISDYKDSKQKKAECEELIKANDYALAMQHFDDAKGNNDFVTAESKFLEAKKIFDTLGDYSNAREMSAECDKRIEQIHNYEKETQYQSALSILKSDSSTEENLSAAISRFREIIEWKDSEKRIAECQDRIQALKAEQERRRIELKQEAERQRLLAKRRKKRIVSIIMLAVALLAVFVVVLKVEIIPSVIYNRAIALMDKGEFAEAVKAFQATDGYKDTNDLLKECITHWPNGTISGGQYHSVGLKSDGTVVAIGRHKSDECYVSDWKDNVFISAGHGYTVGLKEDGSVVATGDNNDGQCDVSAWKNIVAVSAGYRHTIGLEADGTVVATGFGGYGQCDVSDWENINAVSAGFFHTVGLKSDGSVVTAGDNYYEQCNVSGWKDIVAVSAGYVHTVGLKADGTVVATGDNSDGRCDVTEWKNIVAIAVGDYHTIGLKSDGTVVATGYNPDGRCDVTEWKDIVAVSAGSYHTVGLKSDGTVVATGFNEYGQCDVSSWTNIKTTND